MHLGRIIALKLILSTSFPFSLVVRSIQRVRSTSAGLAFRQPPQLVVTPPFQQSVGRTSDRRGDNFEDLIKQESIAMARAKRPPSLRQSQSRLALHATQLPTPPLTPPVNVCLLCKKAEAENRRDHFCSRDCIDAAAEKAPMLLHIPTGNESFQTGEFLATSITDRGLIYLAVMTQLHKTWKHTHKEVPEVLHVYKVVGTPANVDAYRRHRSALPLSFFHPDIHGCLTP